MWGRGAVLFIRRTYPLPLPLLVVVFTYYSLEGGFYLGGLSRAGFKRRSPKPLWSVPPVFPLPQQKQGNIVLLSVIPAQAGIHVV
jgi:hypothetical protein